MSTPLPFHSPAPMPPAPAPWRELAGRPDGGLAPHPSSRPVPRLWRSRSDRVLLGVLGGLAEKFGWETRPVRILYGLFGVLSIPLATLPVLVPYLVLCAITRAHGPAGPPRPFRRSRTDAVLAGVLGGVAEWLGISPRLVRAIFCLLTVLTLLLPGVVAYHVLWARTRLADRPDA